MEGEISPAEARTLKFLKWLVTILTATMILGVLTIVALLVMRFTASNDLALPEAITLPDGTTATAFTQGEEWYAVVTADDQILIYSRATGALQQRIAIELEN